MKRTINSQIKLKSFRDLSGLLRCYKCGLKRADPETKLCRECEIEKIAEGK